MVKRVAVLLEAIDRPGGRRTHSEEVARLGGLALGGGFAFGLAAAILTNDDSVLEVRPLAPLVLGTSLVFFLGVVDDVLGLSAIKKLLVQTAAASLLVTSGWQFEYLGLPTGGEFALGAWSGPLTVVWIVGVTNAINLIDGLDGLAAGVVTIIAASFLVFAVMQQDLFTSLAMAGILGACVGFLPHNWDPAEIFMGDSGAQSLGFLLACLSVHSSLKSPAAVAILVPVLALGVPVIDTLLVMLVRFMERPKGKLATRFLRVFRADQNHLHHLLASFPFTRRQAVRWVYVMVAVSCVMALTVAFTKQGGLGWALILIELVAIVAVRRFGLAHRARQMTLERQKNHSPTTTVSFL